MNDLQRAALNKVFKDYGLNKKLHVAQHDEFTIINRNGIMHLKYKLGISIEYDLVHTNGINTAIVKASTLFDGSVIQTFGEVSPQNNGFPHPVNIAEKRSMSRLVLECVGLYDSEILGADEYYGNPLVNKGNTTPKPATEKKDETKRTTGNGTKSSKNTIKTVADSEHALQDVLSQVDPVGRVRG